MPPGGRRAVGIFVLLLALLYTSLMLYGSVEYIKRLIIINVEAEDLPIATWILGLSMPIGFVLLMIRLLEMGSRIPTAQSEGSEKDAAEPEVLADAARDGADKEAGER